MRMAFHRFVVVASLSATYPTLGRVRPNMTEQAALTRVNLGQQTLYYIMVGSPLSGLVGGLAKAKQFLDLTRNNNNEDLLAQRHGGTKPRGIFRGHGLRWQKLTSMCRNRVNINVSEKARQKCVVRARPVGAQCARAHA
jgi:hypothetical protein